MFDIGLWELAIIAVVALLVLGPERLPEAARAAGRWIGSMRRTLNGLRQELEDELDVPELRNPGKQGLPGGLDDLERMLGSDDSRKARQQQDKEQGADGRD